MKEWEGWSCCNCKVKGCYVEVFLHLQALVVIPQTEFGKTLICVAIIGTQSPLRLLQFKILLKSKRVLIFLSSFQSNLPKTRTKIMGKHFLTVLLSRQWALL